MALLKVAEIDAWLSRHLGADREWLDLDRRRARPPEARSIESLTPGRLLSIVRSEIEWLIPRRGIDALIAICEYGAWPCNECPHLMGLIRGDSCSHPEIDVWPGQSFTPSQREEVVSALWLSLCFGWSIDLYTPTRVIRTDHDGWVWRIERLDGHDPRR
ncbi:MAG: hypothetical protein KF902_10165 [Phycisphaeraceae bacterium]|nr:hypothetical protein [Phycisphaeraceae bacterium]